MVYRIIRQNGRRGGVSIMKKKIFSYFWQALLAGASLLTVLYMYRYSHLIIMMLVPFSMACYSIHLTRKHDLDLSKFFVRRLVIALVNGAVALLIGLVFPVVLLVLVFSYTLIAAALLVLLINVLYIISKSKSFHECLAVTLCDPLHYFVSLLLIMGYLEPFFY